MTTTMNATKWERVDLQQDDSTGTGWCISETDRLAVPGGWLYRTQCYNDHEREDGARIVVAMAFVPQPVVDAQFNDFRARLAALDAHEAKQMTTAARDDEQPF